MSLTRTEAVTAVLDDISAFEINLNHYYEDSEPQTTPGSRARSIACLPSAKRSAGLTSSLICGL